MSTDDRTSAADGGGKPRKPRTPAELAADVARREKAEERAEKERLDKKHEGSGHGMVDGPEDR
jgi:hypothetical protein